MPDLWAEETVPCPRGPQECGGTAEPEEDDGSRYWVCMNPECGFTFGYQQAPQESGACSLGVPGQLQDRQAPVFVEIGRRP
jgi:hypothetical protein